jgi:uncharacterized protein YdhG (YjbR/CyaY superfamily)
MATSLDYIEFVAAQVADCGRVRYRKMFGEYMVYINDKPILLVCDNCVYVKKLPCVDTLLLDAEVGVPYEGAKEHYILDIDNAEFASAVVALIEPLTPLPKSRQKAEAGEGATIDAYIAAQSADIQPLLTKLRATIKAAAPHAIEKIAWQMPTFWQKENLIHFAVAKKHIGIYPGGEAVGVFAERLKGYKTSKGAIQFPLDKPIDYQLITDIVRWRLAQTGQV